MSTYKHREAVETAREWIKTDRETARRDIRHLGIAETARYYVREAKGQVEEGDKRWRGLTVKAMREALSELGVRKTGARRRNPTEGRPQRPSLAKLTRV
jgi:hypothetical protein